MKEGLMIAVVVGLVVSIPVICFVRLVVMATGRLRRTFPRFSLRTMLYVATFLPPLIAGVWAVAQLQWYRSRGMPYGTDRAVRELERDLKARPPPMMHFHFRSMSIVLAIGLALLQSAIFLIPYDVEMTEGTAWFLCLDFVSYVVPLVQISALAIALTFRNGSSSNNQSHAPILRFTIRDVLWLTLVVGMGVAWWQGHEKLTTRLAESETAHRKWHHWTEHLRGQLNGIKSGGKWLMPYRLEFSPGSEEIHTVARQSGGDWVAPAGTTIEWRQDWADLWVLRGISPRWG